jgi:3-dehydroquinate synthase
VQKVTVSLGDRSYDIMIGHEILGALGDAVSKLGLGPKHMVVTSPGLWPLYGKTAHDSLAANGFDISSAQINDDEESKSIETVMSLYDRLVEREFSRDSAITAVGGGVVGDVAGFAAATYMRGMRLVQVPTTLLAQVDSSIGGKTGVNLPSGKNLVGAFHQPALVWTDVSTLKTLPERELRSGMAEVIKYAIVADSGLFNILEEKIGSVFQASSDTLIEIISRCCSAKARIVEKDEKDRSVRSILNYGHTFGHALETLSNYRQFTHGEAVALGMIVAARVSCEIGATDQSTVEKQERLISTAGLPTKIDRTVNPEDIARQLTRDKKRLAGQTGWVLPKTIGEVFLTHEVPLDIVLRVVKGLIVSKGEKS